MKAGAAYRDGKPLADVALGRAAGRERVYGQIPVRHGVNPRIFVFIGDFLSGNPISLDIVHRIVRYADRQAPGIRFRIVRYRVFHAVVVDDILLEQAINIRQFRGGFRRDKFSAGALGDTTQIGFVHVAQTYGENRDALLLGFLQHLLHFLLAVVILSIGQQDNRPRPADTVQLSQRRKDASRNVGAARRRQIADPADQFRRGIGQRHRDRGAVVIRHQSHALGIRVHIFSAGFRCQLGVLQRRSLHAAAVIHQQRNRNFRRFFILDQLEILDLELRIEQFKIRLHEPVCRAELSILFSAYVHIGAHSGVILRIDLSDQNRQPVVFQRGGDEIRHSSVDRLPRRGYDILALGAHQPLYRHGQGRIAFSRLHGVVGPYDLLQGLPDWGILAQHAAVVHDLPDILFGIVPFVRRQVQLGNLQIQQAALVPAHRFFCEQVVHCAGDVKQRGLLTQIVRFIHQLIVFVLLRGKLGIEAAGFRLFFLRLLQKLLRFAVQCGIAAALAALDLLRN